MHRRQLTDEEENIIVETVIKFCDAGHPLLRSDVADAVELFVSTLPEQRQKEIKFKFNRPGQTFLKLFLQRHRQKVKLGRPNKEEEIRFRSCNAETMTTHFASLKKLLRIIKLMQHDFVILTKQVALQIEKPVAGTTRNTLLDREEAARTKSEQLHLRMSTALQLCQLYLLTVRLLRHFSSYRVSLFHTDKL